MINYDGRVFRSRATETADRTGSGPTGHYHQEGDVVWAEFSGGRVRRGMLVGSCAADGTLTLSYCQLLDDGETVSGRCVSTPTLYPDGRVDLREEWERFGDAGSTGVSHISQVSRVH